MLYTHLLTFTSEQLDVVLVKKIVTWLQETYRACESRMTQEGLRRHVLRVLRMWRTWSIFSDDFLNGLQVGFVTSPSCPDLTILLHLRLADRISVLMVLLRLHLVDLKHLPNVQMRSYCPQALLGFNMHCRMVD